MSKIDYTGRPLSELAAAIHANAVEKGWWGESRNFGELMMLVVTEAAEAMEDWRTGREPGDVVYESRGSDGRWRPILIDKVAWMIERGYEVRPAGIPSELADIIVRVLDICGAYNVPIDQVVADKMTYNATRPHRHGDKRA